MTHYYCSQFLQILQLLCPGWSGLEEELRSDTTVSRLLRVGSPAWGPSTWMDKVHSSPDIYLFLSLFFKTFWRCSEACGILVPWPGIKPASSAVKARSPNHWTAREVPHLIFKHNSESKLVLRFFRLFMIFSFKLVLSKTVVTGGEAETNFQQPDILKQTWMADLVHPQKGMQLAFLPSSLPPFLLPPLEGHYQQRPVKCSGRKIHVPATKIKCSKMQQTKKIIFEYTLFKVVCIICFSQSYL